MARRDPFPRYQIVRFFSDGGWRVLRTNVTLDEAKVWCLSPESSHRTCTTPAKRRYTARVGTWFDGWREID